MAGEAEEIDWLLGLVVSFEVDIFEFDRCRRRQRQSEGSGFDREDMSSIVRELDSGSIERMERARNVRVCCCN